MSDLPSELDLIVIGSGPGGYVAAIRAAQLGLTTVVVERDPQFGGTCLHRGCIPTKAWLHTASVLDQIRHSESVGIQVSGDARFDPAAAGRYRRDVIQKNAKGIEFLFRRGGVHSLRGHGRLTAPGEVTVERDGERQTVRARNVLVATGSVPMPLEIAPTDGRRILDSDQILELDHVPDSLVVLGGGAVGAEFASIFASLGSEVTLVEMLPRLLPIEDEEISAELAKCFGRRGIDVRVGTRMSGVEVRGDRVAVNLQEDGGKNALVDASALLVAVGRRPVTDDLGLAELGLELDRGCVGVDEYMRSSVPGLYAIGDVVRTPWLAHVASAEGILAVEHMAGCDVEAIDYDRVPSCTYCEPEVATVGLSEAEAGQRGLDVGVGKFPFSASAKAAILRETAGFIKVVRDKRYDELVGVHIIGPHATDLIAEACVALRLESTTEEIFRTMHAHPTLSEAMAEAAHAALGQAIHA